MRRRLYLNDTATTNLETLPTTQASEIIWVDWSRDFIKFDWTAGSEDNAIVLVKKGTTSTPAQITEEPSDGTDYLNPNLTYGLGDKIGNAYVVHKGSHPQDQVKMTGLTRNTYYSVRVFEMRGSGSNVRYLKTTTSNNPRTRKTKL